MIEFRPTYKQHIAFEYLTGHPEVTEVLFGSGAGCGKSRVGASRIIISALKYPGTRRLVARERLVDIKNSILLTFIDVFKERGINYSINFSDYSIKIPNGSTIIFKELAQRPGDNDFDRLGSLEITGAFIEEAAQVSHKAAQVLSSRIRYRLDEYGLTPKMLLTCNPTKGRLYSEFYMPRKKEELKLNRRFVRAVLSDNPYISDSYRQQLLLLDEQNRKRLLEGDRDYDSSDQDIFNRESISLGFSKGLPHSGRATHITADVAHLGDDNTLIVLWDELHVNEIHLLSKSDTVETSNFIKRLRDQYKVNNSDIAIDIDGLGVGVKDQISPFCIGIHNNATAFRGENYKNLKSQMFYKLAESMRLITFSGDCDKFKDQISQELYAHKRTNIDSDGKLEVTPKKTIRQAIGRSPDFADALAYRMYYEVRYATKFKTKFY